MQKVERLAKMLQDKDEIIVGLKSDKQLSHQGKIRDLLESEDSGYVED